MNKITFVLLFLLSINYLTGQTVGDALRFSNIQVEGTARTVSMGGSFSALGGDYATISINPAGLAVYRNSELILSPSFNLISTDATLTTSTSPGSFTDKKPNFNFSNIGLVFNSRPRRVKWKNSNWALGFNRLANFHSKRYYEGISAGSITDRWVQQYNRGFGYEFESNLAYDADAIYDYNGVFISDFLLLEEYPLVSKNQTITTKGGINEMNLAYAANYNNRLMMGFTVGMPLLRYTEERIYEESDPTDEVPYFEDLNFTENLSIQGIGINLKVGMIYRINQMFRVGFAVHTPTNYSMEDTFSNSFSYGYTDSLYTFNEAESREGEFGYLLSTPWRFVGSAGMVISKIGLLSAEVEWVNYGNASFSTSGDLSSTDDEAYLSALNNDVSNQLGSAVNIRLGAEYALKKLRFRAGLAINGTPYASESIVNKVYSTGIGLREQNFYVDFAYKHFKQLEVLTPYVLYESFERLQEVEQKVKQHQFLLTVGVKF